MKRAVAILLSDTHLKDDNGDFVFDIFQQAIELARELGVNEIFHAGDFFTSRKSQSLNTLLSANKIFNLFSDNHIFLRIIPGNHDKTNQSNKESYLDVFRNRDFIKVIDEYENSIGFSKKIYFHFLPYFENEVFIEYLKNIEIEKNRINILITHHAFNGVKNNDGTEVTDAIPASLVKDFDMVLVGHYHNQSWVGKNIHYFGSAYQHNFGENWTDKGFWVLYDDASKDFFQSKFKRKIKIQLPIDADFDTEVELVKEKYPDDEIRFEIIGDLNKFAMVNKKVLQEKGIDIKFVDEREVEMEIQHVELEKFSKKQIIKYFKDFCTEKGIRGDNFIYGLKILK